jgi:chromosome segregation ATPase
MPNDCEAEQAALEALQKKLDDAHKRYVNAPEQQERRQAEDQIKHMDELLAKYKDTRGYKKRIKEWKAEKRKNEKKLDDAIDALKPLGRAREKIRDELDAADVALRRCLGEPHDNSGALCWCGERGMHAAGTPR